MVLLGQKVLQVRLVVEIQNVVRAPSADAAEAKPEKPYLYTNLYGATIYDIHPERVGVPPSRRHSMKGRGPHRTTFLQTFVRSKYLVTK